MPAVPLMNAKRFGLENEEWRRVDLSTRGVGRPVSPAGRRPTRAPGQSPSSPSRARAGPRAARGPVRFQGHTHQARTTALQEAPSRPQLGERPRPGRSNRAQGDGRHRTTAERTRTARRDDDLCVSERWCRAGRDDVGLGWFRLCRGTPSSHTILLSGYNVDIPLVCYSNIDS